MALMQRLMKFVARSGVLSDARLLELYPPFVPMRIKVLEIAEHWRTVRILLPLNARSRNPGGVMFGDDWSWDGVRLAVLRFAREVEVTYRFVADKWVLDKPGAARE